MTQRLFFTIWLFYLINLINLIILWIDKIWKMTHLLHHTRRVEFLAKPIFPKLLTSFNFKFFHLKKNIQLVIVHVLLHKLLIVFFLSLSDDLFYTNKIDTILYHSKAHIWSNKKLLYYLLLNAIVILTLVLLPLLINRGLCIMHIPRDHKINIYMYQKSFFSSASILSIEKLRFCLKCSDVTKS